MSKPTHGDVKESLEVVWEAIHQWEESRYLRYEFEPETDDVKLSMNIIMDNLGFTFDENCDVTEDIKH